MNNIDDLKQVLKENPHLLEAELCRRSFYYFVQKFWKVVVTEEPIYNWHIPYLCKTLQKYGERVKRREPKLSDLIINIPPGTSKSTICTIMFPAWLWTIDPKIRILTASYSQPLSTDHAVKSRDVILSEEYKRLFPHIKLKYDQNNKTNYKNRNGGERIATSVTGTATGFHAHVIIVDDPLNPKRATSEDSRVTANNFMSETLSSRKVDKAMTPTILVMQRLHALDCTGHLLSKENKKIELVKLPATIESAISPPELEENYVDGLLDPIRLSEDIVNEMKIDLGTLGFLGQMLQEPGDNTSGMFKRKYFEVIPIEDMPSDLFDNQVNMVSDTASKAKSHNDPSAILSYIVYKNDLYIVDYVCKRLEFPELVKEMQKVVSRIGNSRSKLYIEPKSSGQSVHQYLKRNTNLNVIEFEMQEGDKESRAFGITPICEAMRVKVLKAPWTADFLDEICLFPRAAHDEAIDTLVMAVTQGLTRRQVVQQPRTFKKVG